MVSSLQTSPEEDWDDLPKLDVLSSSEFNVDELLESDNTDGVDMPDLDPILDDSESEEEGEGPFARPRAYCLEDDRIFLDKIQRVLTQCQPFPGDGYPVDSSFKPGSHCFLVDRRDRGFFCIYDRVQGFEAHIHIARLCWDSFSIGEWFAERCAANSGIDKSGACARSWLSGQKWENTLMGTDLGSPPQSGFSDGRKSEARKESVELSGIQVDKNKYHALQRNATQVKGNQ